MRLNYKEFINADDVSESLLVLIVIWLSVRQSNSSELGQLGLWRALMKWIIDSWKSNKVGVCGPAKCPRAFMQLSQASLSAGIINVKGDRQTHNEWKDMLEFGKLFHI